MPAGKVLVLENVSGNVVSTLGEIVPLTIYIMDQNDQNNPVKQVHVFAPSYQTTTHKTFYTHQTRIYVPAGQSVYLFWEGDVAPVYYSANVSGYFVDVP